MSGSGGAGGAGAGGGGGFDMSSLAGMFKGGGGLPASQFSADGSTPSQFTMPGGQIPQYQGTQMLPATLGGVQGVADAQDWTQAVKESGGPNWGALGAAAGNLAIPQSPQGQAPAPVRGGGTRGPIDFNPQQLSMMTAAGLTPQKYQAGLLQMLQGQNKGFSV